MMSNHMQAVRIFKALADESRLEIMLLLMDGERCACQLLDALKIGQSTLSHHMRILCESGLVGMRKAGKWVHYSLSLDGARQMGNLIKKYHLTEEQMQTYPKERTFICDDEDTCSCK